VGDEADRQVALLQAVLEPRGPARGHRLASLMLGVRSDTGRDAIAAASRALWRDRSRAAARRMLDAIAAVRPKPIEKEPARPCSSYGAAGQFAR
jgi:hypothetical protein